MPGEGVLNPNTATQLERVAAQRAVESRFFDEQGGSPGLCPVRGWLHPWEPRMQSVAR